MRITSILAIAATILPPTINADENHYCGSNWMSAAQSCSLPCPTGNDSECRIPGHSCQGYTGCAQKLASEEQPVQLPVQLPADEEEIEVPVQLPELDLTTTTPAPPEEPRSCSCSPLTYTFEINLDQDCNVRDLQGKAGIGQTFCFLGSQDSVTFGKRFLKRRLLGGSGVGGDGASALDTSNEVVAQEEQNNNMRQLSEDIEIISIQFLEFDTSGNLVVINQDDSYADTSLTTGDVATFKSIANDLDPSVSIEDQLDFLPGGVQLTIRGRVIDDVSGEEKFLSNRMTWTYTNSCDDVEPLEVGDSMGWMTVDELDPASEAFCPAPVPTESPAKTPTTSPTTASHTDVPITTPTTALPTKASITTPTTDRPTEAPIRTPTTEQPTDAPIAIPITAPVTTTKATPVATTATTTTITPEESPATTTTPNTSMSIGSKSSKATPPEISMPMGSKSSKAMFSKSSKNSKQKKTELAPKTNKTPKNPMAKVHKESEDDGHHNDYSGWDNDGVDAKSGKAKVTLDTKAEKQAVKKATSNDGDGSKSGKLAKTSSKGGKDSSAKGGKSLKEGKATRLFAKKKLSTGSMSM